MSGLRRTIYDQEHRLDRRPGRVVRDEGDPAAEDGAVNALYDGLRAAYDFFSSVFGRDSYDGRGAPLVGMVHYGVRQPKACWDNLGHFVFGDGDGSLFRDFTAGLDVIGHEMTHAIIQHEAGLLGGNQVAAVVESLADVFGIQVKQFALPQTAQQSEWLIGADVVGPALEPALRSMRAPGTLHAKDHQPSDLDHYIRGERAQVNAGIPNRAFCVAATSLGGYAWEAAGAIWYAVLCDPMLRMVGTFEDFAGLTLMHARCVYGVASREVLAVRAGWDAVHVEPAVPHKFTFPVECEVPYAG
jgi:Zn-dependent metalloprotease